LLTSSLAYIIYYRKCFTTHAQQDFGKRQKLLFVCSKLQFFEKLNNF
jgi:hypothetical protein